MNNRINFTPSKPNDQCHAIRAGFTNFGFVFEILFLKPKISLAQTLKVVRIVTT
jgi:hypothetical protein